MQLIIAIIITFIFTLLSVSFGIYVGTLQADKPLNVKLPHIFKRKGHLGAIPKASQIEIEKRGTRREAAEKAMEETLDEIL